VLRDPYKSLDLSRPRTVPEILVSALWLYRNWPVLFVALSAIVVIPYELVVLAVAHSSPLGQQHTTSTVLILALVETALVMPLISALQAHAVITIGNAQEPTFGDVIGRSLRVLPTVAAAEIIAGLGEAIGYVLFIIPGVFLTLRWAVVAQAAAIEETDWPTALRRSGQLARGNYLRILVLIIVVGVVDAVLTGIGAAIAGTGDRVVPVVVGIVIVVLTRTFGALVTAMLYFDLRVRESSGPPRASRLF
jgi:hypothetical protein